VELSWKALNVALPPVSLNAMLVPLMVLVNDTPSPVYWLSVMPPLRLAVSLQLLKVALRLSPLDRS